jgi:hypothetical protein
MNINRFGKGAEFEDGVLQVTRVNFLSARGIEVVVTVDHTRGNQVALRWLLYDGHRNLVRTMAPDYTLSAFSGVGCGARCRVLLVQGVATVRTWVILKTRRAWSICGRATTSQRQGGLSAKTLHGTG